jgi:outer membrane receptor protein involved in Fe transport
VAQQGVADGITGLEGLQFQPQFLAFPNVVESGKTNDDKLTWNIRAAFEINDNFNAYASASTGFKSSSWNLSRDSRPFAADATALAAANLLPNNYVPATGRNFGTRFAGPEEATVYEIGLKAKFDRVAFNLAVFDQTIEGFQSNTFLGTGFSLANAGEQSTQGVEVDTTWTPIDPLTLSVAATFLDPVYDSFVGGPGPNGTTVDLSGQKPAGIPTTALSVGAAYNHEFANGTTGFLRGDWQYESEVQSNEAITVTTGAQQPFRTVSTFNASTGVTLGGGISVQVWARNLFNDEYVTTVFPGVAQAGIINGYRNPPRTYGVNIRQSW